MLSTRNTQWLLYSVFFFWGLIASSTDLVLPLLKTSYQLSFAQVMLVKSSFFIAYLFLALPVGRLVDQQGFVPVLRLGSVFVLLGCTCMFLAAFFDQYLVFLLAFLLLACGVTCFQVSSNPFIKSLGPLHSAAGRLVFAQGFNSLGTTLGPALASMAILSFVHLLQPERYDSTAAKAPYFLIACLAVLVLVCLFRVASTHHTPPAQQNQNTAPASSFPTRFWFGVVGIFVYVGAEVSVAGFLVLFTVGDETLIPYGKVSLVLSAYWFGMMCGRFLSARLLKTLSPSGLLLKATALTLSLLLTAMALKDELALYLILMLGLFKSIMFPAIFSISLQTIKQQVGKGSGLLCMAITGGAVVPLLQGLVADIWTVKSSFMVPAICYVYILWFALNTSRQEKTACRLKVDPNHR